MPQCNPIAHPPYTNRALERNLTQGTGEMMMRSRNVIHAALLATLLGACSPPAPPASSTGEQPGRGDPRSRSLPAKPAPQQGPAIPDAAIRTLAALFVPADGQLGYFARMIDLDGDGHEELVAQVVGDAVCSDGGCSLFVLSPDADEVYAVVAQIAPVTPPVLAGATGEHGWRDLLVAAGPDAQANLVRLTHDGERYPDAPPDAADARIATAPADAQVLIAADADPARAVPLPSPAG